ncbi:YczE/YyaS/YitT family protein [Marinilactibacillus psychrotolerans]|uniref:YczE/YyaS/YitT family protein n=1 Tax=Marinilactibacillus psychrotolerans TaxID=191770 RepID=UPI0039B02F54
MQQVKRFSIMLISMVFVAFAASLTIKAAIGLAAWDAIAQSISHISTIQVGTIGMILNISCVIGQMILLKRAFPPRQLLQIPISILLGTLINYFYYTFFASLNLNNYFFTLVIFLIGTVLASFAVSTVMVLNIITFPLEGFCMALAKKTNYRFAVIRQMVDILAVLFTLILTFSLDVPMTAREGTVIGMLIFAPLMGFFIKRLQPIINLKTEKN